MQHLGEENEGTSLLGLSQQQLGLSNLEVLGGMLSSEESHIQLDSESPKSLSSIDPDDIDLRIECLVDRLSKRLTEFMDDANTQSGPQAIELSEDVQMPPDIYQNRSRVTKRPPKSRANLNTIKVSNSTQTARALGYTLPGQVQESMVQPLNGILHEYERTSSDHLAFSTTNIHHSGDAWEPTCLTDVSNVGKVEGFFLGLEPSQLTLDVEPLQSWELL